VTQRRFVLFRNGDAVYDIEALKFSVTGGSSGPQQGTYTVDGYTLTLQYAGGRAEKRMIVADPSDTGVIWLDGTGYRSKK
jgi:hypothetical protein